MFEKQTSLPNFTFFPVPNPNPLVSSSFDIPEPIIHPPGTDPYFLLNPDLHGHDRFESLPALDIDPIAASRSEIITKTTDLTPSEHAGRALTDTTMVSMASLSPGNTGVVTQHVVNDVIVTTLQSKNTRSIQCDICNITCNSENALKIHEHGKKHLKNMQKLAVSSAVTQKMPPPVANATLDGESDKKQLNLLQNGALVNSLSFHDICYVGCNNQDVCTKHLEGSNHASQLTTSLLCGDGLPDLTSASTPSVQHSDCGTKKAQDKLDAGQSVWCEVCKVSCSSDKVLSIHISGKKHMKNLKSSEKMLAPPSTPIASMATTPITVRVEGPKSTKGEIVNLEEGKTAWCELCKASCSCNILSSHVSGKKDLKNLIKLEKILGLPSTPITSEATPPSTGPVESPKSTKGEIVISNECKSACCELCGISCDTNEMLNKHISGKKHQKNMEKSGKLIRPNPAPAAEQAITVPWQDSVNEEGNVVILRSFKRKAKSPVASHEDLETKRQNMIKEAVSGSLLTCTLCNVICSSPMDFTTHLAGQKHAARVLKQVEAKSNGQKV